MQVKANFELFICTFSFFAWTLGFVAPLFPLLMVQYIRVKYVVNYFTIDTFNMVD